MNPLMVAHEWAAQTWAIDARTLAIVAARGVGGAQSAPDSRGRAAVVPVTGIIVPRGRSDFRGYNVTAMSDFRSSLMSAAADDSVSEIVLYVDSPGGVVQGVPEAADVMRQVRAVKPITALVDGIAGSAAYWLVSQASEISVTPSGSVGSIGVYTIHQDISRALDQAGITTTIVSAGEHKVEGNAFEPLSEEALKAMSESVYETYQVFVNDVALGRNVSQDEVLGRYGQGRMMSPAKALDAGMIDRIETMEAALLRLSSGQPVAAGKRRMKSTARNRSRAALALSRLPQSRGETGI